MSHPRLQLMKQKNTRGRRLGLNNVIIVLAVYVFSCATPTITEYACNLQDDKVEYLVFISCKSCHRYYRLDGMDSPSFIELIKRKNEIPKLMESEFRKKNNIHFALIDSIDQSNLNCIKNFIIKSDTIER
jgi:hypothetical protein